MFTGVIVICRESKEQLQESPETWRYEMERRGMKVSKTEYMSINKAGFMV